jgi:hypothetical protein
VSGDATFMPSADIDTAGSIGFNYGESGKHTFWSMEVAERVGTTINGPVQVVTGIAKSPDSRVGDFSNTTVDPADGTTFWGANEYQGSDFWDTHIASFSVTGALHSPAILAALTNSGGRQAVAQSEAASHAAPLFASAGTASQTTTSQTVGTKTDNVMRVLTRHTLDSFWADQESWSLFRAQ